MGLFNTQKLIQASPSLIPAMAKRIEETFVSEGFEVQSSPLISGGYDISIKKGNLFKEVLGLKTALKVNIKDNGDGVLVDASVGIWGQQVVPFVIAMLIVWPVILAQIWVLIQQSKLDDHAIEIAEAVANEAPSEPESAPIAGYCPECGSPIPFNATECPKCGTKY